MTNKRLTLVLEISFICLVTVRPLLSSVATLYHVNDQLQRAYYSLKLSPSSRSKHLTSSASSQPRPQVLLAFQYAAAILESEKILGTRLCLVPKSYCRSKKKESLWSHGKDLDRAASTVRAHVLKHHEPRVTKEKGAWGRPLSSWIVTA